MGRRDLELNPHFFRRGPNASLRTTDCKQPTDVSRSRRPIRKHAFLAGSSRTNITQADETNCPSLARQSGPRADYTTAAKRALWSVHDDGGKTIYCEASYGSGSDRRANGGLQMNIEHVLPKSKIKVAAGQGDLHNLWPSILKVNEARSNFAFTDNIPGEDWTFAHATQPELAACDFEVESVMRPGGKVTVVEPAPSARGRLARSVLHIALAYGVKLPESEWEMYLRWHEQSAPEADEQRRNDRIEQLQATRNPFIDSPNHGRILVQACRP